MDANQAAQAAQILGELKVRVCVCLQFAVIPCVKKYSALRAWDGMGSGFAWSGLARLHTHSHSTHRPRFITHAGAADGLRVPPTHQPAHAQRGQGAGARTYVFLAMAVAQTTPRLVAGVVYGHRLIHPRPTKYV